MRAWQNIAEDDPNARISRKRGNQFFQPVLIDFAVIAGDSDDLGLRDGDSDIQRRRESSRGRSNTRNASVTQQRLKRDLGPVVIALVDNYQFEGRVTIE
jgi:hypothetical protein